jgi:hypothetical protein
MSGEEIYRGEDGDAKKGWGWWWSLEWLDQLLRAIFAMQLAVREVIG